MYLKFPRWRWNTYNSKNFRGGLKVLESPLMEQKVSLESDVFVRDIIIQGFEDINRPIYS